MLALSIQHTILICVQTLYFDSILYIDYGNMNENTACINKNKNRVNTDQEISISQHGLSRTPANPNASNTYTEQYHRKTS